MHIIDNLRDFFLLVSLMKNKLQLVRLVFPKYRTLLLKWEMCKKKKLVVFLKLCLQSIKIHETIFTVHLKYKKLYNKLYLDFLLDEVCL